MARLFPYIFTADPAAHVFSDGRLWLYADRDPARESDWWSAMCSYHAFSTDNLHEWIDHGAVLSCEDISWRDGAAWDGDCIEANGKFYYFFPMIDKIGVAVADRPQGPFRDALGAPLVTRQTPGVLPKAANGGYLVSPVVVQSPHGIFLYFGQNEELYIVELNPSMTELAGPVRMVNGFPDLYHEGPWVFYRNGLYHMIYGKGAIAEIGTEQSDDLAYATSPNPDGPFTFHNVVQGDNGRTVQACLVEWKDKDIFFYHEDGTDNYHRHLRAEIVDRAPDGRVGLIPRDCSPLVPRSVSLDACGRHYAEDFHSSDGTVERLPWKEKNMGFVRLSGPSTFIQFNNILATAEIRSLKLRVRSLGPKPSVLNIESEGRPMCQVDVPCGDEWAELDEDFALPSGASLPHLIFRLTGKPEIEMMDFRFIS